MINPDHFLKFVESRLTIYKKSYDINYAEYLAYKEKHDAKWYNKLFRNEYTYYANWHDIWEWCTDASWIETYNNLKAMSIYHSKMDNPYLTHQDIKDIGDYRFDSIIKRFYSYCAENNIPH